MEAYLTPPGLAASVAAVLLRLSRRSAPVAAVTQQQRAGGGTGEPTPTDDASSPRQSRQSKAGSAGRESFSASRGRQAQASELTQDKCYRGGAVDEASADTLTQVRGCRSNEHESVRQTRVFDPHSRPRSARRSSAQNAHPRGVLSHLRLDHRIEVPWPEQGDEATNTSSSSSEKIVSVPVAPDQRPETKISVQLNVPTTN